MPGPILHLETGIVASILTHKKLNTATIMSGVILPDLMPLFIAPFLPFKGPALNKVYTFFDQTLIGGIIDVLLMSMIIIFLINKLPKLMKPFTYRQKHDSKTILISSIIGVSLHILFDLYYG